MYTAVEHQSVLLDKNTGQKKCFASPFIVGNEKSQLERPIEKTYRVGGVNKWLVFLDTLGQYLAVFWRACQAIDLRAGRNENAA